MSDTTKTDTKDEAGNKTCLLYFIHIQNFKFNSKKINFRNCYCPNSKKTIRRI